MTNEVRAACEIVRGVFAGKWKPGMRPNSEEHWDAVNDLAAAFLAEHPADDETPIDESWLRSVGFTTHSLRMSMLLPPTEEGAAIVELSLTPDGPIPRGSGLPLGDSWTADLTQGVPDDQHAQDDHVTITSIQFRTRGDVRRLMAALGIPLKEQART